jgi:TrmH family RNA methyltransferase
VVVLEGSADPFGPKAVRASAGNVFRLQVAHAGWSDLAGLSGYGAAAAGGEPLAEAAIEKGDLLVLGNEGRGLRVEGLRLVSIPIAGGVESLNVAAAAAVLLFEVSRRR